MTATEKNNWRAVVESIPAWRRNRPHRLTDEERHAMAMAVKEDVSSDRVGPLDDPTSFFSRVLFINLDRSRDRLRDFQSGWPSDWPFLAPERFPAVDGIKVPTPPTWPAGGPAFGCYSTWLNILSKAIIEFWDKPILVMEDDCQFVPEYRQRMIRFLEELPTDWELAFPGCQQFAAGDRIGEHLVRVREAGRTHCVMIHPRFFQTLYEFWEQGVEKCRPTHVDHMLQHWAKTDSSRKFYACSPIVAYQREGMSLITYRREPARTWDSQVPMAVRKVEDVPVVLLRAPKNVVADLRIKGLIHTGYWLSEDSGIDKGLFELMRNPSTNREIALRRWIGILRTEAAAWPNASLAIWHPEVTEGLARAAFPSVRVFEGTELEELTR